MSFLDTCPDCGAGLTMTATVYKAGMLLSKDGYDWHEGDTVGVEDEAVFCASGCGFQALIEEVTVDD